MIITLIIMIYERVSNDKVSMQGKFISKAQFIYKTDSKRSTNI